MLWYLLFFSLITFLVIYSFFQGSLMGALSVAFIFLIIIVSYVILYLTSLKKTEIILEDWYLVVAWKTYSFNQIKWFNVEFDSNWKFTTFILYSWYGFPLRFTIADTDENVKEFVTSLINAWLVVDDSYENDRLYKIIRFLKIG